MCCDGTRRWRKHVNKRHVQFGARRIRAPPLRHRHPRMGDVGQVALFQLPFGLSYRARESSRVGNLISIVILAGPPSSGSSSHSRCSLGVLDY